MSGAYLDLKNRLALGASIPPQVGTGTLTGSAFDAKDTGPCYCHLEVGTVAGTSPTVNVKITECDTSGGTYADITGATFPQITSSNFSGLINFKRSKRFLKAVATMTGSSLSIALSATIFGEKTIQS
jgi:hypothetical protein